MTDSFFWGYEISCCSFYRFLNAKGINSANVLFRVFVFIDLFLGEAAEDRLSLAETRALGLYQHINGTEILLDRQAREKRSRSTAPKIAPQNSCHYETNSERCTNKVLPFTNFCNQRILSKCFKKILNLIPPHLYRIGLESLLYCINYGSKEFVPYLYASNNRDF